MSARVSARKDNPFAPSEYLKKTTVPSAVAAAATVSRLGRQSKCVARALAIQEPFDVENCAEFKAL